MKEKSYKILFLGRVFIGIVFAYSGFFKLLEPIENFRGAMAAYDVIPSMMIPILAQVIPWLEFVFGVFLVIGYIPRISAGVLAALSWSFVLLILITKIETGRLPENCGCFGEGSLFHPKPLQVVLLDICNTLIGVKLALTQEHPFSLDAILKWKKSERSLSVPSKGDLEKGQS